MNQLRYCSIYVTLKYLLYVQASLLSTCEKDKNFKSKNGHCCKLCHPGEHMKMECSVGHDTVCEPCPPGLYSHVADIFCVNCTKCEQVVVKECTTTTDTQCTCKDGYLCANRKCTKCVEHLVCPRGKELEKLGDFDYIYQCKNCPTNTYSDTEGGRCQNLTVCEKLGKKEISSGNSTHNTICGPIASPPPGNPENLAPYLSVIIVTPLLLLIFLISCLWKRKIKYITPTTMNQIENMLSCPLSKEEKGDLPIQALDSKTSQPSSMEQGLNVIV
ncbi:tumor necrosis factor receptor superfamily member 9-like [Brienomyrus brachyistius]|uniref:tumor necrosis factor receptor superfamily member 9-like n=1 Tax=Brienomyrus brachyistius TaxID=42636 RepID=UPI0020B38C42|nr:tumor necrosis factor receptor superfamily member 9-like [Brienomyrus brachyistius]